MAAYRVNLAALKNNGGSASATVDLGKRRSFLAWGSGAIVDSLSGSGASTGCALNRRILGRPIDAHATARSQSVRSDLSLRGRPRPNEN